MKFIYTILVSVLLLSAASCNRKVTSAIQHTTLHQDSSNTAIDTTKSTFTETTTETVEYGDTLTGDIYLPVDDTATITNGTIESNGITVNLSLKPVKNGFKAQVNAVAKPKSVTKTTTKTTTENKGTINTSSNKKDLEQDIKNKASDKEDEIMKWVGLMFLFLAILILLGFAIYLYYKNKQNGHI